MTIPGRRSAPLWQSSRAPRCPQSAYSCRSVPTASAISSVACRSGWRTTTKPSDTSVNSQFRRSDMRTKAPVQPVEPVDLPDVTRTPGTLKDDRGVVAAFQLRAEAFVQDGFGPSPVEVDVGRVVHAIHGSRAGRPGRDFAEYGFAVLLAIPLHMRESRLKAEGLQHGASHLPAALQMISFNVA